MQLDVFVSFDLSLVAMLFPPMTIMQQEVVKTRQMWSNTCTHTGGTREHESSQYFFLRVRLFSL